MAAEGERNIRQKVGWTAKVGGYGAAVIGVFGPESWIVPGLVIGTGGLILEKASNPDNKTKMKSSGTIFQRAKEIYVGSPKASQKEYALAA